MIEELLRRIPLFSTLPRDELETLAQTLRPMMVPEGTVLLEENHSDDRFYILLEGWVEIVKSKGTPSERVVGWRQDGTLLGEMSLFTQDGAHTASVVALTSLKLLSMTRLEFDSLLNRRPRLAYDMVRILSQRLNESENLTILDLEEKNRMLIQAYEELKAAQAQIIEKEKLEHELEISRQMQLSILPDILPATQNSDFGAMMIPARAVGGDFYDIIPLSDGRFGIVVGDVSDKGIPASLFMALSYSLVRAESQRYTSPEEVLIRVNQHLIDINASEMFVTMVYGIYDDQTGLFTFARAGHPAPLTIDADCVQQKILMHLGQPLGLMQDPILDTNQLVIPPGGLMLIYSDGLSDATNSLQSIFGSENINQAIAACKGKNAQEVCNYMWQRVTEFTDNAPQHDDFTVVAVRRHL